MQFALYLRDDANSHRIGDRLKTLLVENGLIENVSQPNVVIFIGGDGTFLRAVHHYMAQHESISFVGIHSGTLGFFCDFTEDKLPELVSLLKNAKIKPFSYRLLEAKLTYASKEVIVQAVNEIRLENPFHTLIADVHIDHSYLECYRGNGLMVSSVLGSSAYNKSLGGAIVDTSLEAMELTEIATIQNNAYRSLGSSLVVHPKRTISFSGDFPKAIVGLDFLVLEDEEQLLKMDIYLSKKYVQLYHQHNYRYLDILRKTFVVDKE